MVYPFDLLQRLLAPINLEIVNIVVVKSQEDYLEPKTTDGVRY